MLPTMYDGRVTHARAVLEDVAQREPTLVSPAESRVSSRSRSGRSASGCLDRAATDEHVVGVDPHPFARAVGSRALVVTPNAYEAGEAGVVPLHDPRVSHRPDAVGTAYRAALPAWIDVRKCAFCHPETGCLLPREYRAPICREWVCELWESGSA